MSDVPPTFYLFAGCNGSGKTTFAGAYLRQLDPIPRFLNADEIARGLSPLDPRKLAIKAGKLMLHEIQDCLESGIPFGLESTLSGTTYVRLLQQAKSLGYQIEIHYLWLPSPELAIRRIAQRVKMGAFGSRGRCETPIFQKLDPFHPALWPAGRHMAGLGQPH